MYVMFPIGIMYYFGTNLDRRFAVPDFWPKAEQANKIPLDKDEIHAELERLRARRLFLRDKRLAEEAAQQQSQTANMEPIPQLAPQQPPQQPAHSVGGEKKTGWFW